MLFVKKNLLHYVTRLTKAWEGFGDLCRKYEIKTGSFESVIEGGGWHTMLGGVRAYKSGAMYLGGRPCRGAVTRPPGSDLSVWARMREDSGNGPYAGKDVSQEHEVLVVPWTTPGVGEVDGGAD